MQVDEVIICHRCYIIRNHVIRGIIPVISMRDVHVFRDLLYVLHMMAHKERIRILLLRLIK